MDGDNYSLAKRRTNLANDRTFLASKELMQYLLV